MNIQKEKKKKKEKSRRNEKENIEEHVEADSMTDDPVIIWKKKTGVSTYTESRINRNITTAARNNNPTTTARMMMMIKLWTFFFFFSFPFLFCSLLFYPFSWCPCVCVCGLRSARAFDQNKDEPLCVCVYVSAAIITTERNTHRPCCCALRSRKKRETGRSRPHDKTINSAHFLLHLFE